MIGGQIRNLLPSDHSPLPFFRGRLGWGGFTSISFETTFAVNICFPSSIRNGFACLSFTAQGETLCSTLITCHVNTLPTRSVSCGPAAPELEKPRPMGEAREMPIRFVWARHRKSCKPRLIVWDSGKSTPRLLSICLMGAPLQPGQRGHWHVRAVG